MNLENTVGLFGTCGKSKWRDQVKPILEAAGVDYFDPVAKDWNEEARLLEVHHATCDRVIMLVITGETSAVASLAESGWLVLNAVMRGQQVFIVLEDWTDDPERMDVKQNNDTRQLLRNYMASLPEEVAESVQLCETVEEAANQAVRYIVRSNVFTHLIKNPDKVLQIMESLKETAIAWE